MIWFEEPTVTHDLVLGVERGGCLVHKLEVAFLLTFSYLKGVFSLDE